MINIVVQNGQGMLDIALRAFGDVTKAFDIALQNNLSLTDDLISGQVLIVDSTAELNYECATAATEKSRRIFDYTFDKTFE